MLPYDGRTVGMMSDGWPKEALVGGDIEGRFLL